MRRTRECGAGKVSYDDDKCQFVCSCSKKKCIYIVDCGTVTTSGENPPRVGDPRPGVRVDGRREEIAKVLAQLWGRPVVVADGAARDVRINKAVTGTREQIARALGLKLR
jgi:hypothetical protein